MGVLRLYFWNYPSPSFKNIRAFAAASTVERDLNCRARFNVCFCARSSNELSRENGTSRTARYRTTRQIQIDESLCRDIVACLVVEMNIAYEVRVRERCSIRFGRPSTERKCCMEWDLKYLFMIFIML